MSQYYKARKTWGIFDPRKHGGKTPAENFSLSRSKIDLFIECPRCFYLDRRIGVGRPPGFPFNLNNAVDKLLKKEFDIHRAAQSQHPLLKTYGLDAVPLQDDRMEEWRDAMKRGVSTVHKETGLLVRGGVDDVWVTPDKELIIADYKATSKDEEVTLDAEWQDGYKRQMEVYQWLFRQNGFKVANTGYFVYVNGKTDKEAFDGKLEFDVKLIPYVGDDSWVEKTLVKIKECLEDDRIPPYSKTCDYCNYISTLGDVLREHAKPKKAKPTDDKASSSLFS